MQEPLHFQAVQRCLSQHELLVDRKEVRASRDTTLMLSDCGDCFCALDLGAAHGFCAGSRLRCSPLELMGIGSLAFSEPMRLRYDMCALTVWHHQGPFSCKQSANGIVVRKICGIERPNFAQTKTDPCPQGIVPTELGRHDCPYQARASRVSTWPMALRRDTFAAHGPSMITMHDFRAELTACAVARHELATLAIFEPLWIHELAFLAGQMSCSI